MDAATAFGHEEVGEEFYVEVPKGAESGSQQTSACKHVKALYGLYMASG